MYDTSPFSYVAHETQGTRLALETVHIIHAIPGEVLSLECSNNGCTLPIIWDYDAEIDALVVVLDNIHDSMHFLRVLDDMVSIFSQDKAVCLPSSWSLLTAPDPCARQ